MIHLTLDLVLLLYTHNSSLTASRLSGSSFIGCMDHGQLALPEPTALADGIQSNFLPIPSKRALPLPNLSSQLLTYISNHFQDGHPEAFRKDVDALVGMRKELVEAKAEAHPEVVKGLMRQVQWKTLWLTY